MFVQNKNAYLRIDPKSQYSVLKKVFYTPVAMKGSLFFKCFLKSVIYIGMWVF